MRYSKVKRELMNIFGTQTGFNPKDLSLLIIQEAEEEAQNIISKQDRASFAETLEECEELAKRIRLELIVPRVSKDSPIIVRAKMDEKGADTIQIYQECVDEYQFEPKEGKALKEEIIRYFLEKQTYMEKKPFITITMFHGVGDKVLFKIIWQLKKSGYGVEHKTVKIGSKETQEEYVIK